MSDGGIYGPEHEAFRAMVRKFVREELAPRAREFDEAGRPDKAIFRRLGELGLLGICIPAKYGGEGMDYLALAVVCEELERVDDPRLEWVSVTGVEVSPELSSGVVYFSSLAGPEGDVYEMMAGIASPGPRSSSSTSPAFGLKLAPG